MNLDHDYRGRKPASVSAKPSLPAKPTLPPHAAERLNVELPKLYALADAATAGSYRIQTDFNADIGRVQAAIGHLDLRAEDTGWTEAMRAQRQALKDEETAIRKRQPAIMEAANARMHVKTAFQEVLGNCKSYAAKLLAGTAPIIGVIPDVTKRGERYSDQAKGHQAERQELLTERIDTDESWIPMAEMFAQVPALIEGWSRTPEVIVGLEGGKFAVEFPSQAVRAVATGDLSPRTFDARALIAWLHPERLQEEIERQIEDAYKSTSVPIMTRAERRVRLKEIDAKLLELERLEAECIWRALADGEAIHFRPDTDPRAVLGIA